MPIRLRDVELLAIAEKSLMIWQNRLYTAQECNRVMTDGIPVSMSCVSMLTGDENVTVSILFSPLNHNPGVAISKVTCI